MLAEILLKRDPRSVTDISAPTLIGPSVLVAAVLLRVSRRTLIPPAIVSDTSYITLSISQFLYLGSRLRFRVFGDDHVELQWKTDPVDNDSWQIQLSWGEPES